MPGLGKMESTITGTVAGIRMPGMGMEEEDDINFDDSGGKYVLMAGTFVVTFCY